MANHIALGKLGEKLAATFLIKKGFKILHQNWRHDHWEIDIIALQDNVLHFVEVKTRRTTKFGYPEDDVTNKKLSHLIDAACEFQFQYPQWKIIQFDILSIILNKDGTEEFFFIEDVYL